MDMQLALCLLDINCSKRGGGSFCLTGQPHLVASQLPYFLHTLRETGHQLCTTWVLSFNGYKAISRVVAVQLAFTPPCRYPVSPHMGVGWGSHPSSHRYAPPACQPPLRYRIIIKGYPPTPGSPLNQWADSLQFPNTVFN